MIRRNQAIVLLSLVSFLMLPVVACAKTVKIPKPGGGELELSVSHPPGYQAGESYSILVGPGEYYWQDRPSQPGWVVATGEAFFGDGRVENSKAAIEWLRKHYQPKHGGFHIAGWSANSAGVFEIAMAHPKEFLSVTGIAGMPGPNAEGKLDRLKSTRVQFVVGEKDSYWRRGSERWHAKLQAAGIHSALEIIANGEHVMPELANEPIFERLNSLVAELGNTSD